MMPLLDLLSIDRPWAVQAVLSFGDRRQEMDGKMRCEKILATISLDLQAKVDTNDISTMAISGLNDIPKHSASLVDPSISKPPREGELLSILTRTFI